MVSNGIQRSIGRIESKLDSLNEITSKLINKVESHDDVITVVKNSCPIVCSDGRNCGESKIKDRIKNSLGQAGLISIIVSLIEIIKSLINAP